MYILLIEDSRCFSKAVSTVSKLSDADIASFVMLDAESSPIWNNNRCLSAYIKAGNSSLLSYIGFKDSVFDGYLQSDLLSARLVIPASALLTFFDLNGFYLLKTRNSVCAIEFTNTIPQKIGACAISENVSESEFKEAVENAKSLAGISSDSVATFCSVDAKLLFANRAKITLSILDKNGNAKKQLCTTKKISSLYSADLRDVSMLKESQKLRFSSLLNKVMLVSALVFVFILCICQICLFLESGKIASLSAELSHIEPKAKSIEAQSAEISLLDTLSKRKTFPILQLAKINEYRPNYVILEEFKLSQSGEIYISGNSGSITLVKKFNDALVASGDYKVTFKSDTSRGKTRFSMNISAVKK